MGFLKRFFRHVFEDEKQNTSKSSFEKLTEEQWEAHLGVVSYGDFRLTDAVRPSYDLQVVPSQGYRFDVYSDEETGNNVPVLMAAATNTILFDLFMELIDPLGFTIDVVLETSHQRQGEGHEDLYREHIDMPVLKSVLWDYEQMLLHDGCTGMAVLNPEIPQEVQFDEHKLLLVYGDPLQPFQDVLESRGVKQVDDIKFITEAEHIHSSSEKCFRQFDELKMRLGMDDGLY